MLVTKQNHRFWLFQYGKEPTATIAGSTVNFAAWIKENDVADVTPIYGDIEHVAFALGLIPRVMEFAIALRFMRCVPVQY